MHGNLFSLLKPQYVLRLPHGFRGNCAVTAGVRKPRQKVSQIGCARPYAQPRRVGSGSAVPYRFCTLTTRGGGGNERQGVATGTRMQVVVILKLPASRLPRWLNVHR
uniref:Uncharacterized protein n=1 Tax=Oryza sativa subsp. japonica TaxID=39947 RepID=Q75G70_ORYSJ|nr:hypothetical protein OSJNBa0008D12.25 [Oryza sativa Japonica Group]